MTETREQLPMTEQTPIGEPHPGARADERRAIGRRLHRGILQELTVAGFRLKALEEGAAPATAAAIADFAAWLREQQAELRRYVARLEQGLGDGSMQSSLAALADALEGRCRLSIDPRLDTGALPAAIAEAMVRTVEALAPVLADALGARSIAIALDPGAEAALRMVHEGGRLQEHSAQLALVRQAAGRNGASLRIETQPAGETLILDWAN